MALTPLALLNETDERVRCFVCAKPRLAVLARSPLRLPSSLSRMLTSSSPALMIEAALLDGLAPAVELELEPEPANPPKAQLASIQHLMLQSHVHTNTGVDIRTFNTGKRSGYLVGALKRSSQM